MPASSALNRNNPLNRFIAVLSFNNIIYAKKNIFPKQNGSELVAVGQIIGVTSVQIIEPDEIAVPDVVGVLVVVDLAIWLVEVT